MAVNLNSHSSVVVFNGCYPLHPAYPFQFHHHPLSTYGNTDGICGRPLAPPPPPPQPTPHAVPPVNNGYLNGELYVNPVVVRDDLLSSSSTNNANRNGNSGGNSVHGGGGGGGRSSHHRRSNRSTNGSNHEPTIASSLRGVKGYGLSHATAAAAFHTAITATSGIVHPSPISLARPNGNYQGLGHSSKTSAQVQPTSGGKSSGNMIAVPPPPPPPHHAQISPSGSGGIQTHNTNARTSSFAAALRKLAEQATDPVTDKELSPVSPANSPTPTSTPKRGTPSLVLISDSHSSSHSSTTASHIPSVNFTSSPTVTMAPTQSYIDGRKNSERPVIVHSRTSAKGLFDDSKKSGYSSHRSHGEPGQEDGNRSGSTAMTRGCPPPLYGDRVDVSSSPAKSISSSYLSSHQPGEAKSSGSYYSERVREESGYLTSRPPPAQPLRLLSPSWSHHTPTSTSSRLDDHIQVNSSFQPYRPSPEDLRHGISPHIASTYESTSPYGYHPAAFLPPQLQHPSFRFDDPLYMERCSLFRPPLFSLPHPGVLPPHHALSFFSGSRYTPELLPHPLSLVSPTGSQLLAQERLKLEEQRRERTFEIFDQERSRGREREPEREADYLNDAVNGKEQEKRQRNSWSIGPTIESPVGTGSVGSITQGIPRADLVSRASPVRPMMPSPSPSRLTSAGSSVELPSSHVSRHSKSPTELADRGEGRSSYSNNYHGKTYISSYNRERSPTVDRDHFNMSRVSNYETGHYESSSDGNNTTRKTSRSSGTRSKDHAAYNSVSRHLNVSENNYSNVNHLVPEVVQSNCGIDASRQNVSTVEQSNDDDGRGKKLSTIAFHSLFARDSEGISGKFVEPEARAAANTNHNVEELNIVPPWDHYLQLSPTPSRQQLKLDKCDQIVPVAKNYQEPIVLCDKIKSKLDLAAERARLKRFNNQDESSDVDEEDGIDFSNRYQNLIIYSGPPLPLDTSRQKLHFMSQIGLVTQKRKRELELDQYIKHPRVLNGTCNTKVEKFVAEEKPPVPWFLNASCISMKYSADDLRREPELSQKVQFFLNLNLNLVPLGKRDDNEKILQAVIDEKIRRNGFARPCHSKLIPSTVNSLTPSDENSQSGEATSTRSLKRKLDIVVSSESDQPLSKYILNSKGRPSTVSDNQTTASTREGQALKNRSQENRSVLFTSAAETVSDQYKKYGRDFAQEFHESVWLQTKAVTKKSNIEAETTSGGRNCISDGISPSPSLNACLSESGIESQSSWPGIEMLMAAYQKHQQEQRLERDVLSEQCSRLLAQNRELNNSAEKLSQKMADYLNLKTSLNSERQCLHQAIDNLKCFLKDLR